LKWIEADALRLPFPDSYFDLITAAFGFRNLPTTMRDCARWSVYYVREVSAAFWILASRADVGEAYRIYFKRILPAIGR